MDVLSGNATTLVGRLTGDDGRRTADPLIVVPRGLAARFAMTCDATGNVRPMGELFRRVDEAFIGMGLDGRTFV